VDSGLNMASVAILGSVTWHTSNVSVIDHTMSGGSNNLLFGHLTLSHYLLRNVLSVNLTLGLINQG